MSTTTITREGWLADREKGPPRVLAHALVIAWSLDEPERLGESALLGDESPPQILGRGGPAPDDGAPRVRFARQRPSGLEDRPPLAAAGISRRQLLLKPSAEGVRFERVGKCAVRQNGAACDRGVLKAGDVLTLQGQLVLACVRRATRLVGPKIDAGTKFGAPDADGIVGESEEAWRLREAIALLAPSPAHVLVLGASGTGKELAARAIHRLSTRAREPFVARSAASFPGALIDAELFGNRRDYPNAGMPEREGVVGAANGGTLFLDEIGELAHDMQSHLLRLMDSGGEYHRLGDARARKSDVRIVAATNRDPSSMKADFAARFAARLTMPGLEARREDVPLIARHVLDDIAAGQPEVRTRFFEKNVARIDPAFVEALLRHDWSLHVRELRALLWSSVRTSPAHYLVTPPELEARDDEPVADAPEQRVRAALEKHDWNQSKAYVELGLPSRFALYRLMNRLGIKDERRK